jgi:hypothetical protein
VPSLTAVINNDDELPEVDLNHEPEDDINYNNEVDVGSESLSLPANIDIPTQVHDNEVEQKLKNNDDFGGYDDGFVNCLS